MRDKNPVTWPLRDMKMKSTSAAIFTFLTSLTHHLSMVKFSEKKSMLENFRANVLKSLVTFKIALVWMFQANTTQCPRAVLKSGPLDPKTSALTMRPLRLHSYFFIILITSLSSLPWVGDRAGFYFNSQCKHPKCLWREFHNEYYLL